MFEMKKVVLFIAFIIVFTVSDIKDLHLAKAKKVESLRDPRHTIYRVAGVSVSFPNHIEKKKVEEK